MTELNTDVFMSFIKKVVGAANKAATYITDVMLYNQRVERQKHLNNLIKWTGKTRLKKKYIQELREITVKIERVKGVKK